MSLVCYSVLWLATAVVGQESAEAPPQRTNSVRLVLPPSLPVVVGYECNLYFDNVTLVVNPANWALDVECAKGQQLVERWTWIPTEKDVGDHALTIHVRNQDNELVASAQTTVRVVAADRNDGRKLSLLCIGDSLTHAGVYTQRLLDRSAIGGNPRIQLVGSHQPGNSDANRHEGYGGWTARRFATHFAETARMGPYQQRGSPFLYKEEAGKTQLDFPRYCRDVNGGQMPDIATIFLGPNDIFSYQDKTLEAGIDDMLQHLDLLIDMLRTSNDKLQIALLLPVPPAATQDAFGANYGAGQTRWQYKRNQHRLVERMLERYSTRSADRIHVVPTYVGVDCVHNYPSAPSTVNALNDAKVTRLTNGVHPSAAGYQQIGDQLFAWIKSQ